MTYIQTDQSGRVIGAAAAGYHLDPKTEIAVDPPREFSIDTAHNWIYRNGEFIYSPLQPVGVQDSITNRLDDIEAALMELADLLGGE